MTYDYESAQPSYTVTVKVDDGNGGTDTVTVTIDLTDVNEPPLEPVAPRVTATPDTTDSLTVSWSAPSNTGRPAIDTYDLQYREGTTGSWTNGPQNETGTSTTITGPDRRPRHLPGAGTGHQRRWRRSLVAVGAHQDDPAAAAGWPAVFPEKSHGDGRGPGGRALVEQAGGRRRVADRAL